MGFDFCAEMSIPASLMACTTRGLGLAHSRPGLYISQQSPPRRANPSAI
jgi:hypothetical protein